MVIIKDNFKTKLEYPTYIALGSFDGLHLGHMHLVNKAVELSKENNAKSMICTFKNHPLSVINKEICPQLIMDNDTKIKLLEGTGIDIVNLVSFDKDFMKITPEQFIKDMVNFYNTKGIVVGFNYRFGYKNLGDVEMLQKYSSILGYKLYVCEAISNNNEVVSSSNIRHLIAEGNIIKANELLGRPHSITGEVIKGKQLGRTIGFPTVNLNYNKQYIIPKGGVYYTLAQYDNNIYKAITNIGYNPTVEGGKLSVETYILNFDKQIYGENVKINFVSRIRDEVKFDTVEELRQQLIKDKEYAIKQKK
ncbi:bifunctional riboflavin kinase/FAD synthetase [Clostridium tagluense]|uniref:bifunctional riboflavin kinase/FAD synthetase n=1 Tax=Clostridium tagluense TaxID=360422 RepID=UPI001C0CFC0F|nr:bifunctional riboflavin kinase/FAD synthetase [Clostridium tagluense]MBU3126464.1 bifunctional riboflavin kinase/FAD synthetase [Clostridium tagluense]MCB2309833.1 bifunctional riboflavin kinase/FAD synthetase [Clostridium tagluense]MCB2314637.1 bifunctional riboflavin kinase/FAD synthetase [Clostridium tagluense]MCB2319485.1 bifunctional riboflavin kinase/FAD synthetase [Clostridium tagluense]MCB2324427.1 bifunctional riboflavin kinase/FAD synthetase [Clostridium tagluense]